jgi:hypothetical protein
MKTAIKCTATWPDLEDNTDLFDALFAKVCERSENNGIPPDVILCQMIFHASREVFLSADVPFSSVKGVIEASFIDCVNVVDTLDERGASAKRTPQINRLANVALNVAEVRP